ncbi:IPT/TIG domain-containing protein [Halobacteriovorax sp. HLS]|uniref:IPT/TIG domain-containing protein n=1 Tax=Halobacteriovorax sp. HLS TaxID=2234000 RepID=UPI000FDCAFB0|nr:IPT/TIG domain-containing protein [Halobacteriovorax sp. HLS]
MTDKRKELIGEISLKNFGIILFILTLLNSCSAKKKGVTTSLKLFSSAISSTVPIGGGLYIVGKSSTGEHFAVGVQNPSQEVEVDLKPGEWSFGAIAWDGSGSAPLTGTNRCGKTTASIAGSEVVVNLSLNENNCLDPSFADSTHMNGNQFNTLRLVGCRNLVEVDTNSDNTETCSDLPTEQGIGLSYRIVFKGLNSNGDIDLPNLYSACIVNGNISSSDFITNIKLPLQSLGNNFPFAIVAYEDLNCNPEREESIYLFGMTNPPPGKIVSDSIALVGPSANQTSLFIADNHIGIGTNPLGHPEVAGGIIPKLPNISAAGVFPDPTENTNTGTPYENVTNAYWNVAGTSNLVAPWEVGTKGALKANDGSNDIYEIKTTTNTDGYNNFNIINTRSGAGPCSVTSTYNPTTQDLTLTYCDQVPGPIGTNSAHLVTEINSRLSAESLASYLVATDLFSATVFSHTGLAATSANKQISNGKNPSPIKRRETGQIGEIAEALAGHIGALISLAGYPTCSSIPNNGQFTFIHKDIEQVTIEFAQPQVPMSIYMNNNGSPANYTFEKRVLLRFQGVPEAIYEFNCPGSSNEFSGYYRSSNIDGGEDYRTELFYETFDPNATTIDFTQYYVHTDDSSKQYKNRSWTLFKNSNSTSYYELWHARYVHNVTDGTHSADRYFGKVYSGAWTEVSSQNFSGLGVIQASSSDWTANPTATQNKYTLAGAFSSSASTPTAPSHEPSMLSTMTDLSFQKMIYALPEEMAPMAPQDHRLIPGLSPHLSYMLHKKAIITLDKWSSLNGSGCASTVAELENFLFSSGKNAIMPHTYSTNSYTAIDNEFFMDDGDSLFYYSDPGTYSLMSSPGSCSSVLFKPRLFEINIDSSTLDRADGFALNINQYFDGIVFDMTTDINANSNGDTPVTMKWITTNDTTYPFRWYGDQVFAAPTISSVTSLNTSAAPITIHGTNFHENMVIADDKSLINTCTTISETQIICTTNVTTSGPVNFTMTNGAGQVANHPDTIP